MAGTREPPRRSLSSRLVTRRFSRFLARKTSCQLHWKVSLALGFFLFVLFCIALGFALESTGKNSNGTKNWSLPALLFLNSVLWLAASGLSVGSDRPLPVPIPDFGSSLILFGALTLAVELCIRLLCAPQFGGEASLFHFGLKCGGFNDTKVNGTLVNGTLVNGTTAPPCTRLNWTFEPEFDSFGHCIQGCLSLLLFFPCIDDVWARTKIGSPATFRVFRELTASMVVGYPVYNIIKRVALHREDFASSSFSNNSSEWAFGFLVGLSVGIACTSAANRFHWLGEAALKGVVSAQPPPRLQDL